MRLKLKYLVFICCFLLVITGCQSRTVDKSPSEASSVSEIAEEVPSSEIPSEPEVSYVTDAGQISEALEIVEALLKRAEVADEIYRGAVKRDDSPTLDMDGLEYKLVIDERFATYDDLQDYLDKTFTRGGVAAERFEEMRLSRRYLSANGQLHVLFEISQVPLTLGKWDTSGFKLVRYQDDFIEAFMPTMLVGQGNGERTLSLIKAGEDWLLDDTYFLDV